MIPSPVHDAIAVAAVRGSRRVLVASSAGVFLWDLDAVLPHELPLAGASAVPRPIGAHALFVAASVGDAHPMWLDVATGAQRPAPDFTAVRVLDASDATRAVVASLAGAAVVRAGTMDLDPIEHGARDAAFAGSNQLVTGDARGALVAHDSRASPRTRSRPSATRSCR